MATGSNDIDEIYHRMAVIRRELHTNVRESVAGAETVVDWGRYTWTYPWIALGAAAVVGYLVYTSSQQTVTTDTTTPAEGNVAGEPVTGVKAKGQEGSWFGRKLLLTAWDIVFPVAVRAGQNFVLHWLEQQHPPSAVGRTGFSPAAGWPGGRIAQADR